MVGLKEEDPDYAEKTRALFTLGYSRNRCFQISSVSLLPLDALSFLRVICMRGDELRLIAEMEHDKKEVEVLIYGRSDLRNRKKQTGAVIKGEGEGGLQNDPDPDSNSTPNPDSNSSPNPDSDSVVEEEGEGKGVEEEEGEGEAEGSYTDPELFDFPRRKVHTVGLGFVLGFVLGLGWVKVRVRVG